MRADLGESQCNNEMSTFFIMLIICSILSSTLFFIFVQISRVEFHLYMKKEYQNITKDKKNEVDKMNLKSNRKKSLKYKNTV